MIRSQTALNQTYLVDVMKFMRGMWLLTLNTVKIVRKNPGDFLCRVPTPIQD